MYKPTTAVFATCFLYRCTSYILCTNSHYYAQQQNTGTEVTFTSKADKKVRIDKITPYNKHMAL